jgi:Fe-S cluster assembly protein SufD
MISDDESSLDYSVNGKIEKGNSKSSCQQSNKGIILSQAADIKVVPTLLIDEYDVEASHGAAIGRIDDNQLFYLLSRGLNETQAKNLIISGYINPFIHKIKNEVVEEMVKRRVHQMI